MNNDGITNSGNSQRLENRKRFTIVLFCLGECERLSSRWKTAFYFYTLSSCHPPNEPCCSPSNIEFRPAWNYLDDINNNKRIWDLMNSIQMLLFRETDDSNNWWMIFAGYGRCSECPTGLPTWDRWQRPVKMSEQFILRGGSSYKKSTPGRLGSEGLPKHTMKGQSVSQFLLTYTTIIFL